jgi:hypothetical protein
LKEERNEPNVDYSWTMVGSEYERLGQNGMLQSVYYLPVHLQNTDMYTELVNQEEEEAHDVNSNHNAEYELEE